MFQRCFFCFEIEILMMLFKRRRGCFEMMRTHTGSLRILIVRAHTSSHPASYKKKKMENVSPSMAATGNKRVKAITHPLFKAPLQANSLMYCGPKRVSQDSNFEREPPVARAHGGDLKRNT